MISSFFEPGRFALTLRTARSLLGGATGLEQPREPYVQGVTAYSAVICWVSQHPGSGVVEYGKTPELGRKETDPRVRRRHVVALAGLDPCSTYHYRVGGVGESSSKGKLAHGPSGRGLPLPLRCGGRQRQRRKGPGGGRAAGVPRAGPGLAHG